MRKGARNRADCEPKVELFGGLCGERYGPSTTCYNRFVWWRKLGVWDRIFAAVAAAYEGDLQMVDSSSIRVHQH